ncbi:MAG TPA: hypothetical protein VIR14_06620 [Gaiellaceae bacterium]|jgi:hypothetical protein
MSWTSGTHDMNFVVIDNGGSWHIFDAFADGFYWTPGSTYDRYIYYTGSGGGCENPTGLSTVYVNCRNAAS